MKNMDNLAVQQPPANTPEAKQLLAAGVVPENMRSGLAASNDPGSEKLLAAGVVPPDARGSQIAANDEKWESGDGVAVSPVVEVAAVNPEVQPGTAPEDAPTGLHRREGKKIRVGIIDTNLVESRARDIAEANLNIKKGERHGVTGFLKKIWQDNLAKEYYRQKEIQEVLAKIKQDKTAFIDEAGGDQNTKIHQAALGAIVDRYMADENGDMLHTEGKNKETKNVIDDKTPLGKDMKDLIYKHGGSATFDEAAFNAERVALLKTHHGEHADLTQADNLLEAVKQVRSAVESGEINNALDAELEMIVGQARAGARTEAGLTNADHCIQWLQKTPARYLLNETSMALAVGAVYSFGTAAIQRVVSSKVAATLSFSGTAAIGAGLAAQRERTNLKMDRAEHARQMAQGGEVDATNGKRRAEMETRNYKMEDASALTAQMNALYEADAQGKMVLRQNLKQSDVEGVLHAVADAEARIRMSDSKDIDLIKYSSSAKLEQERFALDMARAKAKVDARQWLAANPAALSAMGAGTAMTTEQFVKDYIAGKGKDVEQALNLDIDAKDKLFKEMRTKKAWQAAGKAFVGGLVIGGAAQELAAFLNPHQQGLLESAFHHDTDTISQTPLEHWFGGTGAVGAAHESLVSGHHYKMPEGVNFSPIKPDGSYSIVHGSQSIDGLKLDSNGVLDANSQQILADHGVKIAESTMPGTPGGTVPIEEWVKHQPGTAHVHRGGDAWYDNNTKLSDGNEVRVQWKGAHGTGVVSEGHYQLDVSHMVQDGSKHGMNIVDLSKFEKLKVFVAATKGSQGTPIEIPINADGTINIDVKARPDLAPFFGVDSHGKAEFLGGVLTVDEVKQPIVGGVQEIRDLAALVGKGSVHEVITSGTDGIATTTLEFPTDVDMVPPILPVVGRESLEALKKSDGEDNQPASEVPVPPPVTPESPPPPPATPPEVPENPAPVAPPVAGGGAMVLAAEEPVADDTIKNPKTPDSNPVVIPAVAMGAGAVQGRDLVGSQAEGAAMEANPPGETEPPRFERVEAFGDTIRRRENESDEGFFTRLVRFIKVKLNLPDDATLAQVSKARKSWLQNNHNPGDRGRAPLTAAEEGIDDALNRYDVVRRAVGSVRVAELEKEWTAQSAQEEEESESEVGEAQIDQWAERFVAVMDPGRTEQLMALPLLQQNAILRNVFDRFAEANKLTPANQEQLGTKLRQKGFAVPDAAHALAA